MSISIGHVETAYAGWGQYLIATVRLADGTIVRREIEHHGAAACVLPYDPARKTAILVRQFRAPVGAVFTMPGISTERMHLFLAVYGAADRIGEGGGLIEEHEGTRPVETTLLELSAMADAGTLVDLKTLALLQTLRTRRPDLFAG